MDKEIYKNACASFDIECDAIRATQQYMEEDVFGRAVELLSGAARIAATGCGHSGIACMHFCHSMCCVERPARFLPPAEAVHGATGYVQRGDVMVWASRGGQTDEIGPILDICRAKEAHIIGITENVDSPLARASHVVLRMAVPRESDRFNSQCTASFAALCAVFDALQIAVMEHTGYRSEQFALIHPGGAVGKRLNGG